MDKYTVVVAERTLDKLESDIIEHARIDWKTIKDTISTKEVRDMINAAKKELDDDVPSFRGREDFIQNLHAAQVHLMICLEDIKYPLSEQNQICLETTNRLIAAIMRPFMEEDIREVVKALSESEALNEA